MSARTITPVKAVPAAPVHRAGQANRPVGKFQPIPAPLMSALALSTEEMRLVLACRKMNDGAQSDLLAIADEFVSLCPRYFAPKLRLVDGGAA